MMQTNKRVLVVGAGAAGLMAAGAAAESGAQVVLLERNERPARKLMITGKGRCNVTNNCLSPEDFLQHVPVNGRFLYSALTRFMPADTLRFFEEQGVPLKIERGDRVFPVSDRAADVVDALVGYARRQGVRIQQGRAKRLLVSEERVCGVETQEGEALAADAVIVCTGGLSYPATGSTGDGYLLAEQAGHRIIPPKPSLVALQAHEGFCSALQGLSLRNVAIKLLDTRHNRVIYTDFGELLFTHFGLSGPVILSASSHMREMERGVYRIIIDLKPALSEQQLDARILRDFSESTNRNYINALNALLPKKLVPVVVKLSGVPMQTKVNQVTREQRAKLISVLKGLTVTILDFRPIDEAVITSGGVCVQELEPRTLQSKLLPGLFFAGELLDVDAYTGGFNLQIAFSTGRLAGYAAAQP